KLTVDEEVLEAMGQTDLAALEFHEALYKAQRMGIAKPNNSVSARFITGAIFSNLPVLPSYKAPTDGIENATYKCASKGGDVAYIVPTAIGKYNIQVVSVLGERVFDKTVFEV